jgi:hypothetical protein
MESERPWVIVEGSRLVQCTRSENSSGCLVFTFIFTKDGHTFEQTVISSSPTSNRNFTPEKIMERVVTRIFPVSPNMRVVFDNNENLDFPLL